MNGPPPWGSLVLLGLSGGIVALHAWLPDTLGLTGALLHAASGWIHVGLVLVGLTATVGGARWWGVLPSWAFLAATLAPGVPASGPAWEVATHNAYAGNPRPEVAAARWLDEPIDLLAVQELTPAYVRRMAEPDLHALLPRRVERPSTTPAGLGVYSRTPLTDVQEGPGWLRVQTAGRVVYSVHARAPFTVARSRDRVAQLRSVAHAVQAETLPVVVLGDLNVGPTSPVFRQLLARSGLRDAVADCRRGWTATWSRPGMPTLLRLDHVLTDVPCTSARVLAREGSDHAPVRVGLAR